MRCLGDIVRLNARRFGSETALIFEDQTLTFAELNACADGIARRLLDIGIRPGERVAMLAENCLEYFPIYFAIVKIGAVMVPLNYRCTVAELRHMITDSTPRVLFHTADYSAQASALSAHLDRALMTVTADRRLLDRSSPPIEARHGVVDELATATIMYTSGTTGVPKGAMLPHRALLEGSAATALAMQVTRTDRVVVTVPLFHGGGLFVVSHPHLYVGASIVLSRRFEPDDLFSLIDRHRATTFFGVPTQYGALLDRTQGAPANLRTAWYGAAPMPVALVKRSRAQWPNVRFQQCYGQTETTLISVLAAEDHERKLGSCGRELPHIEVRVVDESGAECASGVVGEVVVDQRAGMTGYFNNPVQTAEAIRGGWIHTGDLGFMDDERFLTLVDRKKDMILSGGENIYPKEIEEVLYACQGVMEAAVVGTPDEKWGEVAVCFVVVSEENKLTAADLQTWCEQQLARYKIPRQWRFLKELPKTVNGKVRKPVLREMLGSSKINPSA